MKHTILALGILMLAGTAAAEQRVFQWSATELTTLDGIAAAHRRVESTARRFCRNYLHGTREMRQSSACVAAVMDEIVASVDDQRLSAYAKTGTVSRELLATR